MSEKKSEGKAAPANPMDPVAQIIFEYKNEAELASTTRRNQNKENFDSYHLRQDYSHKQKGQSMEFLAKQPMAVEQLTSFMQQGLMDQGDWFRVELEPGITNPFITEKEMQKLLSRQLTKVKFSEHINDGLKLSEIGSLMIAKVGGKDIISPSYFTEPDEANLGKLKLKKKEHKNWQLDLSLVRQEDWFPDPSGRGLYDLQRVEMDYHQLVELAKDNPQLFDMAAIKKISESTDDLQDAKKSRETNQNVTVSSFRKKVTLYECWGDFVDRYGSVLHRNSVAAIDLNGNVVMPPRKNPFWHGERPYVVGYLLRVPHSVWHKALMDAPTRLNTALNELYNLMLDDAMGSVYGVRQIRTNWLKDPSQVSNGIIPGMTLQVTSSCPPGQKVLERVDTSALSQDALAIFNLTDREFQQSALTNDTRMGSLAQRQVKATEIVAANQTITGVMNGVAKLIEENYVSEILRKAWLTMAQHMNDLDSNEVASMITPERAKVLANTPNEEIFAQTAVGRKYKVFGLSQTLNKIQDFRKIQALLQSIGASPVMLQEFTRKYSMTKLLGEIIKSLDIDEEKIQASPEEQQQRMQEMMIQAQAQSAEQSGAGPTDTVGGRGSNPQAGVPQASATSIETGVGAPMASMNQGMTTP